MSHPMSIRLPEATVHRLGRRAGAVRLAPRTLAQRYVEEGLRMDEHPMVRFVDGPGGRRARMLGGPDVSDVIATVRDNDGDLVAAAEYLGRSLGVVQSAVAYYGAYRDEVDGLIARNEHEAAAAHAAWLSGRAALGL